MQSEEAKKKLLAGDGAEALASLEVLIGTAMNRIVLCGQVPPLDVAQIGQYAENKSFGKPCGLMDQAASAVGGFAGTVQAYVPNEFFAEFSREIELVFGQGSCRALTVRPAGGVQIL